MAALDITADMMAPVSLACASVLSEQVALNLTSLHGLGSKTSSLQFTDVAAWLTADMMTPALTRHSALTWDGRPLTLLALADPYGRMYSCILVASRSDLATR